MIGAAATVNGQQQLMLFGGGATCFSMGTFWETGVFSVDYPHEIKENETKRTRHKTNCLPTFMESCKVIAMSSNTVNDAASQAQEQRPAIVPIPRIQTTSSAKFEQVLKDGRPVVIEGLNLGECTEKWTPNHMIDAVGADKEVRDTDTAIE